MTSVRISNKPKHPIRTPTYLYLDALAAEVIEAQFGAALPYGVQPTRDRHGDVLYHGSVLDAAIGADELLQGGGHVELVRERVLAGLLGGGDARQPHAVVLLSAERRDGGDVIGDGSRPAGFVITLRRLVAGYGHG